MVAAKKIESVSEATEPTAVERARAHRQASADIPPGDIVGAVPGLKYSQFVTRDYTEKQAAALRKFQVARGYRLADSGEFMVGEPDAELWVTSGEIGDDEWKDEFLANLLNPAWLQLQTRRSNHGIAKKVMELGLMHHNQKASPEQRASAKDALVKLVRSSPLLNLQARY